MIFMPLIHIQDCIPSAFSWYSRDLGSEKRVNNILEVDTWDFQRK